MDSLHRNPFPHSGREPENQQNNPGQTQSSASQDTASGTFAETIQQRFEAQREGIRQHLALIGELRQTIARLLEVTRRVSNSGE